MIHFVMAAALLAAPAEDAPAPAETHWYGWETLATDAGAIGFAALTAWHGSSDTTSLVLGLTSASFYFVGGPIVHLAHGRGTTALADFGLRLGIPLAAGLLFGALSGSATTNATDCPGCDFAIGFLLGAGLGGIGASIVDAAWLAREPVPPRARLAPSIGWMLGRDGQQHPSYGVLAAF